MCLDKLIEVLKEPRFQPLESDYRLTSRLSMVREVPKILSILCFKIHAFACANGILNRQWSLINFKQFT